MTATDDIRSRMLHRADRLVRGMKDEEAWHLVGLFQQTHPNTFLQICHHTLASFLELTHDYFDQKWPLISRLLLMTNKKKSIGADRRGRSRVLTASHHNNSLNRNTNQRHNNVHEEIFQSPICCSPLLLMSNDQIDNLSSSSLSPVICNMKLLHNTTSTNGKIKNKLKPGGKRLLKQLLPSMFPIPNNNNNCNTPTINSTNNINSSNDGLKSHGESVTPTKKSNRSGSKTKLFFKQQVQPLFCKSGGGSNETTTTTTRQFNYPLVFKMNSSKLHHCLNGNTINLKWRNNYTDYCIQYCNIDSTICSILINYMISNPKLCQTEGLFRIPGNSLRIRELWLKLSYHLQTPYLRVPQPDPDESTTDENLSPYPMIDYEEIHDILQSYTPHDISSLILRCLNTCTTFQRIQQVLSFDSSTTHTTTNTTTTLNSPMPNHSDQYSIHSYNSSNHNSEYPQTGGLIPLEAGNLLFLATELQYKLKSSTTTNATTNTTTLNNISSNNNADDTNHHQYDDWMYVLCQSRQLLTYRIVIQLLLPIPERYLLMNLLRLFKQIDDFSSKSKMTAECLSRCTAFAVFGAPIKLKSSSAHSKNTMMMINCRFKWNANHHNNNVVDFDVDVDDGGEYSFESYTHSIAKRIDTLTNLIKMVHQLEDLPTIIYNTIRNRLRIHLGNSPIPRTTTSSDCCLQQQSSIIMEKCTDEYHHHCSLVDDNTDHYQNIQLEHSEPTIQKRIKYENNSIESNQTHTPIVVVNEIDSLLNSNRPPNQLHRTKSTLDTTTISSRNRLFNQPLNFNESQQQTDHSNDSHVSLKRTTANTTTITTTTTTNNNTSSSCCTNNTMIDSFHLWKRHKPGSIHHDLFKPTLFNSSSSSNSRITKKSPAIIPLSPLSNTTTSSTHHHHPHQQQRQHKMLIKSRSSSFLEHSYIFN
ncbi:unnamed protein product [Schistosoma turkestanicum]|nr:unnamed protein product [Schistosoma turkestanicum]